MNLALIKSFAPIDLKGIKKAELMNRIDRKFVVPQHMISDILAEVIEYYLILEKHITPPHKEILPLFRQLKKQKKKIGLVSNSMHRTIRLYLQKYRLAKFVDFIFSSEDAGCKKNDNNYWIKLIWQQKLNPQDCLVIGDDRIEDKIIPQKLGFISHLITNPSALKSLTAKII